MLALAICLAGCPREENVRRVSVEAYQSKMKVTQGVGGWGASLVITDLNHHPDVGLEFN